MFLFDKPDKEHTRNEAYHLYLHLVSIVINCLRIIRESNTCFAILCPKIPVEQFLVKLFCEGLNRERVFDGKECNAVRLKFLKTINCGIVIVILIAKDKGVSFRGSILAFYVADKRQAPIIPVIKHN